MGSTVNIQHNVNPSFFFKVFGLEVSNEFSKAAGFQTSCEVAPQTLSLSCTAKNISSHSHGSSATGEMDSVSACVEYTGNKVKIQAPSHSVHSLFQQLFNFLFVSR